MYYSFRSSSSCKTWIRSCEILPSRTIWWNQHNQSIGGDIALHSTGLIGVDLFVVHFPKRVQKAIDVAFKVIMLVFLAVLVYFGFQYVMTGYKRLITTLNVSYAYVTASVPVGALLMIIIELLKRGHRLVADDAVEIRQVSNQLIGTAPEIIRHYVEIRGVGIIDSSGKPW